MDFYDIGTSDDGEMGLVDYGPGDVKRQMGEVNDFLTVINRDIENDVKKTKNNSYLAQWKNDVWIPWVAFYGDFKSWKASSPSMFRDATYRRAEAYRQLGLRHRENLSKKMDSEVTPVKVPSPIKKPSGGPALEESPNTVAIKNSGWSIPWKWIIGGALVAGGGYMAYKYWPKEKEEEPEQVLIPAPNPFAHTH